MKAFGIIAIFRFATLATVGASTQLAASLGRLLFLVIIFSLVPVAESEAQRSLEQIEVDKVPVPSERPQQVVARQQCPADKRVYRSLADEHRPEAYQTLRFLEGASGGTARISEYRDEELTWVHDAEFLCSNGAVTCKIISPLVFSEKPFEAPFERFTSKNENHYVVIPAFRQSVYNMERFGPVHGDFEYTGVKARWENASPEKDELILPYNVFRYAGCAKSGCEKFYYHSEAEGMYAFLFEDYKDRLGFQYYKTDPSNSKYCEVNETGSSGQYVLVCSDPSFTGVLKIDEEKPLRGSEFQWRGVRYKKQCITGGEYQD